MFETKLIERDFSFRPRKKKVQFSRLSQLTMVAAGLGISLGLLGGTSTSSQTNAATQATVTQQQIAIALPSISDTAPPATDTPIVLAKADIASNANIVEHKDAIAEIAIKAEQQELQSQPVQQDNDVIIEVAKAHELEEAVRAAEAFAAATQNQSKSAESIATEWKTVKVLKGDTVAAIFQRHGYSQKDLHNIVNTNSAGKSLAKVHPGDEILFLVDADNKIQSISHEIDSTNSLNITRVGKKWDAKIVETTQEIHLAYGSATIRSSLFTAANEAGLPDKVTMQLATIFGWDVDFAMDIRENDKFFVLYEEIYAEDERIGTGDIVAAEFHNRDSVFQAVRYKHPDGTTDYFTPDGRNMRKAFMRTPIEFARISSKFNLKRKHPVLNKIRAHKGVDYSASTGTPIRATGDGKIIHVGKKGGYGKTIIVQHGVRYSTLYAHLSKYAKNMRNGARIKQGQVIGYVGRTGLATGPHLHYEFRVDGIHRDPLKVKFPDAEPIGKKLREDFHQQTSVLMAQLDVVKNIAVAMRQ